MAALWITLGIIVVTAVAMSAGALLDYMQFRNLLPPAVESYMMPPWIAALGGLVASITSASLASRGRQPASKAAPKSTAPVKTSRSSADAAVPGMPTFDFSKTTAPGSARQDAARPAGKEETKP
jgi:hypothetical protein